MDLCLSLSERFKLDDPGLGRDDFSVLWVWSGSAGSSSSTMVALEGLFDFLTWTELALNISFDLRLTIGLCSIDST